MNDLYRKLGDVYEPIDGDCDVILRIIFYLTSSNFIVPFVVIAGSGGGGDDGAWVGAAVAHVTHAIRSMPFWLRNQRYAGAH